MDHLLASRAAFPKSSLGVGVGSGTASGAAAKLANWLLLRLKKSARDGANTK
jgi:hypothetical protein